MDSTLIPKTSLPHSLGGILRASCTNFAGKTAIKVPEKEGYRKISYKELGELTRRWASGLRSIGLKRGDKICILSENCLEWALLDWAGQTLGIVVVPIYPTLPADQAKYIVQDSAASIVLCSDAKQMAKVTGMTGVQTILIRSTSANERSMTSITDEAALIAKEAWNEEIDNTTGEDIATIIYTSGTTGVPKGVMLRHSSFIWMNQAVSSEIDLSENDIFLSFLPMSHVFERANGHFLPISLGSTIAYVKNVATLAAEMQAVQPTAMLVVPRFLEAIRDRILDGVKKQPPIRQKLFQLALSQGKRKAHHQSAPLHTLLDRLVGQKIRDRVGGRLRVVASGGAALPADLFDFFAAFGIPVQQGYGLTETCSGIVFNNPSGEVRSDTVGTPLPGVELKIAEDGEILTKGAFLMAGYHNLPKETAEVIDPEGWFHTGDIGEIDRGYLRITDRKKDILVLGNGKNVAPQPIENKLRGCSLITEAVLIGDGLDSCVALILPDFERLRLVTGSNLEDGPLAVSPEGRAAVKKEIDAVNKTLAGFEMVKRFALIPAKFSIEGGELTPSLKVKRKPVLQKYQSVVDDLLAGRI